MIILYFIQNKHGGACQTMKYAQRHIPKNNLVYLFNQNTLS